MGPCCCCCYCAEHLQVITTLNTGKLFYCGVFHPDDDKQNVLMSGCGDKKIYQFDLNTGDVEQVGLRGVFSQALRVGRHARMLACVACWAALNPFLCIRASAQPGCCRKQPSSAAVLAQIAG